MPHRVSMSVRLEGSVSASADTGVVGCHFRGTKVRKAKVGARGKEKCKRLK